MDHTQIAGDAAHEATQGRYLRAALLCLVAAYCRLLERFNQ